MGAGLGVAAPDQAVQIRGVPRPVEAGLLVAHQRLKRRLRLVLGLVASGAGGDGDGGGDYRLHPQRVQALEVEAARRVCALDGNTATLDHDGPSVDARIRTEDGHPRLALAQDDLPGQRGAAPEARQQRGMEAQRATGRGVHDLRRENRGHIGQDVELGAQAPVRLDKLRDRFPTFSFAATPEAAVAQQRDAPSLGLGRERVWARALRGCADAHDLVAGVHQAHQNVPAKGGLAEERDPQRHGDRLPRP